MRTVLPVSPGEILNEDFLKPLGLTKYSLAKKIGVPRQRIGVIMTCNRSVTADTNLRFCRYFSLSDGMSTCASSLAIVVEIPPFRRVLN
jgi:antitoxin HigA-1